jgi:hypothetical protein
MMAMPVQFLLFQPFVREHGVTLALIGVLIVPIELSVVGGSLFSGRVTRRLGISGVGLLAIGGTAAGSMVLPAVGHIVIVLAFALPRLAFVVFIPALSA